MTIAVVSAVHLVVACWLSLNTPIFASHFLQAKPSAIIRGTEESVRASLLEEIEAALGPGTAGRHVARLESALAPMYAALPKNAHGNLGHATVRYALHRIFVQRHAWYIKGLEPDKKANKVSSSMGVMKDRVPTYVQGLLEARLDGLGFNLHDTAVFAAVLEDLIRQDSSQRAAVAFKANNASSSDMLTQQQVRAVLDTYMKIYLLGDNATEHSDKHMTEVYPSMWKDTQTFIRDVGNRSGGKDGELVKPSAVARIIEEVDDHYGLFQDSECRTMKDELLRHGDRATGRIRLSSFYKAALHHGSYQFHESAPHLRQLGALDETDPRDPRVIIPNYVTSSANCLTSSGMYAVCCLSECEALLAHLEREIVAPEAEPSHILGTLSHMSSATINAPRTIASSLVDRLQQISLTHNGMVPLHGRLFAQFMHHAFPSECPYPRITGQDAPQTPDEWIGEPQTASLEQMREIVKNAEPEFRGNEEQDLPWTHHEELLVERRLAVSASSPSDTALPLCLRRLAFVVSTFSAMVALVRSTSSMLAGPSQIKLEKHLV